MLLRRFAPRAMASFCSLDNHCRILALSTCRRFEAPQSSGVRGFITSNSSNLSTCRRFEAFQSSGVRGLICAKSFSSFSAPAEPVSLNNLSPLPGSVKNVRLLQL
jgi:hypothetical protein